MFSMALVLALATSPGPDQVQTSLVYRCRSGRAVMLQDRPCPRGRLVSVTEYALPDPSPSEAEHFPPVPPRSRRLDDIRRARLKAASEARPASDATAGP